MELSTQGDGFGYVKYCVLFNLDKPIRERTIKYIIGYQRKTGRVCDYYFYHKIKHLYCLSIIKQKYPSIKI